MSVFSLSMSVVFLPRPYLPKFGSHAFLLNCLVFGPYIACSLVAGYSDGITQVLNPVPECITPAK